MNEIIEPLTNEILTTAVDDGYLTKGEAGLLTAFLSGGSVEAPTGQAVITYGVYGDYYPQTLEQPAEYPEVDDLSISVRREDGAELEIPESLLEAFLEMLEITEDDLMEMA